MRVASTVSGAGFARLFQPVDIASLVVFRILFGSIVLWEVFRYFGAGWIHRYYIQPQFHFKYYGFEWVQAWPGWGMHAHFVAVGVLAVLVVCGVWYRVSALLLFLGFTYVFLLDQARYLNHFYLVSLVSFLMIFLPAHRARSFDASRNPGLQSEWIPAWPLWALRGQLFIVYFYAGIAKLNEDWLRGQPLGKWLKNRADDSPLGWVLSQDWSPLLFSYGGLFFDLLIAPLLLWRRTRLLAFAGATGFHLMNAWLFQIGIFPWFMIGATLLFFSPSWPRRFCFFFAPRGANQDSPPAAPVSRRRALVITLLALYFAFQILFPFRHFLYPHSVHWTEEGHRFSWHMKLRDKSSVTRFYATDPVSGKTWEVNQKPYLNRYQRRKMGRRPDMILQFAHYLAEELRKDGYPEVEIRVRARVSLNGRKRALLVDPEVNLADVPRSLRHASWILPLTEPLPGEDGNR